jgi:methionyl aminopeptidase
VIKGLAGHGVGRTIHEEPSVPNYYNPFQADVLTEGLVLTIEPMISAGSEHAIQDEDGWTLRTRDGSLSAHHEQTLVITRGAAIVLTASSSGS